jgi:hypothetical protein
MTQDFLPCKRPRVELPRPYPLPAEHNVYNPPPRLVVGETHPAPNSAHPCDVISDETIVCFGMVRLAIVLTLLFLLTLLAHRLPCNLRVQYHDLPRVRPRPRCL